MTDKKPTPPKRKAAPKKVAVKKAPVKKRAVRKVAAKPTVKKPDARIGNEFWKVRARHGRRKIFGCPKLLWDCCMQYFQWVEDNPLLEQKVFHTDGKITKADISKMRAMTIGGLCIFLDVDQSTWENYRSNENYKDFFRVITRAEEIIRTQKFTGAAADLLNPNIIARDLGLAEKKDYSSSDGSMSPKSLNDFYADVDNEKS